MVLHGAFEASTLLHESIAGCGVIPLGCQQISLRSSEVSVGPQNLLNVPIVLLCEQLARRQAFLQLLGGFRCALLEERHLHAHV